MIGCKCKDFLNLPESDQSTQRTCSSLSVSCSCSSISIECSCTESDVTSISQFIEIDPYHPFSVDGPKKPFLDFNKNQTSTEIFNSIPKKWPEKIQKICCALLKDVLRYCQENHLTNFKELAVMEIFSESFKYFVNSKIANRTNLIDFFQEQTLRYAVDHPPKSLEMLSIDECYQVIQYFGVSLLKHVELLRAIAADNYEISIKFEVGERKEKKKNKKDKIKAKS